MGKPQENHGKINVYHLVNTEKTIENGPVEIVDFPVKNVDLSIVMLVYQRVMAKALLSAWWFGTMEFDVPQQLG